MKILFLLRHAKSTEQVESIRDFDRPLSASGFDEAKHVGRWLQAELPGPELVFSSPALRARQTIEIVLTECKSNVKVDFAEVIYEATVPDLLVLLHKVSSDIQSVLMVGHNPSLEGFLSYLTGDQQRLAPAAIAKIVIDSVEWNQLSSGDGRLQWLRDPKP